MIVVAVDSSSTITGDISGMAEAARQICEVRDAMLFVYGETAGLVVWPDGECPCGFCSAKGVSQGRTCEHCKGTGKR